MKTRTLFILLMVLTGYINSLKAQAGLNFKVGEINIIDYRTLEFLGEDNEFLYSLVSRWTDGKKTLNVNKYLAKDYSFVKSPEIKILDPEGRDFPETEKPEVKCEAVKMFNGKFFLISSYFDKSRKSNTCFVSEFDGNGKPTTKPVPLHTITTGTNKNKGSFQVSFSKDNQYMAVVSYLDAGNKDGASTVNLKVFKTGADLLFTKDVLLPYRYYSGAGVYVSPIGDVVINTKTESLTSEEKKSAKGALTKYEMSTIEILSGNIFHHTILFPDEKNKCYTDDCNIRFDDNGNVICIGEIDSENGKAETTSGYYFIKYSTAKQEPLEKKTFYFTNSFLEKNIQDEKLHQSKHLKGFYLNLLFPATDGGFFLVFTNLVFGNVHSRSGSVIIVKTDATGAIAWEQMILKDQPGDYNNKNYYGCMAFMSGGKLRIIYNDNPDNINTQSIKDIKPVKDFYEGSKVFIKTYNNNGTVETDKFEQPTNLKLIFRPDDTFYNVPEVVYTMIFENGCKCHRFGKIY